MPSFDPGPRHGEDERRITACRCTTARRREALGEAQGRSGPGARLRARGKRMEVASRSAATPRRCFGDRPLRRGSRVSFAGFLRGEAVPLVPAKTVDLLVQARPRSSSKGTSTPGASPRGPVRGHTGYTRSTTTFRLPRHGADRASGRLPDHDCGAAYDGGWLPGRGGRGRSCPRKKTIPRSWT